MSIYGDFACNDRQIEIINAALAKADKGELLSLQEVYEMDWAKGITKTAVRFTMHYILRAGYLKREKQGWFTFYSPTQLAYENFRPKKLV